MDRTGGDAMTSLLDLLCLGLSVGISILVNAGTIPRPILWAEPGSVVLRDTPVALWCRGTMGAQQFHLVKTGISPPWETYLTLQLGDKVKVSVLYITESHAGTYQCSYVSPAGWSENSEPLELVVTGLYSKPSLSPFLSPVVASGEAVTLQCDSRLGFDTFVLTQEGHPETRWKNGSQRLSGGGRQALFKVGPVTPVHTWSFQCYGFFSHTPQKWSYPSDPLQLLVSGTSRRPSLLSPQGQIVTPGQTPTLHCNSKNVYDTFTLYKEKSRDITQHPGHIPQAGLSLANFILGPVNDSHGGRYRCTGKNGFTSLWSEPSDPIDIFVAEQLSYTPTLSVVPGPSVSPGDNVTLLCRSTGWLNTFLLAKERATNPPLRIKVDTTEEKTQAQFSFHPVTSAHNGTYRCYSSNSISPYRLSRPSVSLHLWVSGPSVDSRTMSTAGVDTLLIGLSTAGALLGLLLLLLLFLLLFRRHRQAGHHNSGAAHPAPQDTGLNTRSRPSAHIQEDRPEATISHKKSKEGAQLDPQSRQDEDPHGATYAQVKRTGLRQGVASCSPLSGPRRNAQDQQTEEDTQAGGQKEAPEAPLEVTYAQLKHLDTAQESTAPPPSLSGEPPEEPSVYAALAFH